MSAFIYALILQFFRLILNTFFRDIRVRGAHKIPKTGPVLFAAAPYANQFVDPLMLAMSCERSVGFLAAKKSMDKFWIGLFARWMHSIPVQRPQDLTVKGVGRIVVDDQTNPSKIRGIGTKFSTQIKERSVLSFPKIEGVSAEVVCVVSDTELELKRPFNGHEAMALLRKRDGSINSNQPDSSPIGDLIGTEFKITPYVNQSDVFGEVVNRLSQGGAVGIFPEGGSHDRPEMLPLKAGVCIMALDAMVAHPNIPVKIVPCGLNYYHADKFRSRAVIEYGDPITIPAELVDQYKRGGNDKRAAIGLLLDTITVSLKALTLQAPDFDTLMVIQAARRLYKPQGKKLDIDTSLALSRNFAQGYMKMRDHPRVIELTKMVMEYNRLLKYYGVKDHQVKNTNIGSGRACGLLIYRSIEAIVLLMLALPIAVLSIPMFVITRNISRKKAAEAKAGSSVKISGKDVVATWKLLTAMVVIPVLWIVYSVMTGYIAFKWYQIGFMTSIGISFTTTVLLPVLAFASIRISDIGIDIVKSLPPLFVALTMPANATKPLRILRTDLAAKITQLTYDLGPTVFGDFELKRIVPEDDANMNLEAAHKLGRSEKVSNENLMAAWDDGMDDQFFFVSGRF